MPVRASAVMETLNRMAQTWQIYGTAIPVSDGKVARQRLFVVMAAARFTLAGSRLKSVARRLQE